MASLVRPELFHNDRHDPERRQCRRAQPTSEHQYQVGTSMLAEVLSGGRRVDVVVFSAPQLSLYELHDLAALRGARFTVPLLR